MFTTDNDVQLIKFSTVSEPLLVIGSLYETLKSQTLVGDQSLRHSN